MEVMLGIVAVFQLLGVLAGFLMLGTPLTVIPGFIIMASCASAAAFFGGMSALVKEAKGIRRAVEISSAAVTRAQAEEMQARLRADEDAQRAVAAARAERVATLERERKERGWSNAPATGPADGKRDDAAIRFENERRDRGREPWV